MPKESRWRISYALFSCSLRKVFSLVTLGAYSDPPISSIKLAINKLGVPISPAARGPALPIREEAHENVESVLREAGLLTVREVG